VFLVVDLVAGVILLPVDALFFPGREFAAVGRAIGPRLLVDVLFRIFGFGGFRRRHLAAVDPVGDALLLIIAALADLIVAVMFVIGVVLVVVDRLAEVVLLLVDLLALLRRQLAAIGRAVIVNFLVQIASRLSRFLVPAGISDPFATPWAMRPCWL